MDKPIDVAVTKFGTKKALADALGVSYQAVQQWVASGRPPVERAIEIERATNGEITRKFLRPDIFSDTAA